MTDTYLDHPELTARYLYPLPNHFNDPFFVNGPGFQLGCRYLKISDDLPTIIHFHGNGETVEDYLGDFENRITEMKANLLLAEFRGYGMSSGDPGLVAMLNDVQLIVEASGVSPERIIFFGRSLGSLYAVHGASLYPQAAGLIIESGLADPLERILVRIEPRHVGATMESLQTVVNQHLNQKLKIEVFKGRVLIMHTRNDDLVSLSHAERLYEWAHEPEELLVFERGDHNTIMAVNEKAYFDTVARFISTCCANNQR
ncbi:MAG: alpha/beta hydrolase [Desulfuromonadaceae bacterium]|nr:alpha/beta hydrolase [Desulfuromonadaceae bacterium]MDD5106632.1 alpha/beta hydrolase [Desulfuromonadaceae bacterium]